MPDDKHYLEIKQRKALALRLRHTIHAQTDRYLSDIEKLLDHFVGLPQDACPTCCRPPADHGSRGCDMVWGRRGWRQLGVYDG